MDSPEQGLCLRVGRAEVPFFPKQKRYPFAKILSSGRISKIGTVPSKAFVCVLAAPRDSPYFTDFIPEYLSVQAFYRYFPENKPIFFW